MKRRTLLKSATGAALVKAMAFPAVSATLDYTQDDRALYVSPRGSDENGTGEAARPFATPARALSAGRNGGRKHIILRGGVYELHETVKLSAADTGLRLDAWPGETVVLSGGSRLTGVKQTGTGRWEASAPLGFEQLYVNGQRRYRPRLPKNSYYLIARDLPPADGRGYERLAFEPDQVKESWANQRDIEVLCFQVWTMARMKLKRIRKEANIAEFTGQTIGSDSSQAFSEGRRFIVENVKEALTDPGEWYLDRPSRTLTYLPLLDENLAHAELTAPRLAEILRIEGARDVMITGLTFAHAAYACPANGDGFLQAEASMGAAIVVRGGRKIVFEDCRVKNVGAWAIAFEGGCKDCQLLSCELTDLGAGGVKIGDRALEKDAEKVTERIAIEGCLIAHGGRVSPAGTGIWIGHSPHNRIKNNEITDFYYTGISVGWSWGYGESGAHHNEIAFNRISKIGQRVLSDLGGIYTVGAAAGTTLHHNIIYDIQSDEYGGWGIYFDEGTTGIVAENQLVFRTGSASFQQHYGRANLVRNSIFAYGTEAQLMRTRSEGHLSFRLERNIIFWKDGQLLGGNWSGEPGLNFTLSRNLYWKTDGSARVPPGDSTGLVADPNFLDPENGDFRLNPSSPAEKIGYLPWDFSLAGRPGRKPSTNQVPSAYPQPPPLIAARPLTLDFEDFAVGQVPTGRRLHLYTEPEIKGAGILIADDFAFSGGKSLKFTDIPGQKARYNPHLYFTPGDLGKDLVGSFALRLAPGAVFHHEWRDGQSPYKIGPSLRVEKNELQANGKVLMTLPVESWVVLDVRCRLGSGLWELSVVLQGQTPPRRFLNLPCGSGNAFEKLAWWGFVSDADTHTYFWVDDLSLNGEL